MTKFSLVTGGAGFIGSNLVKKLEDIGRNIIVIDDFSTGSPNNLENCSSAVKIIHGDSSIIETIELPKLQDIYHLGIPSSSPIYKQNPSIVGETITTFTRILEQIKQNIPKTKIIYASTSSIYNGNEIPFREDMPVYIKDYYTECRYAIERMAKLYHDLHGINSIGLRFFSVYGPHEEYKRQYANMITQFLWELEDNRKPIIYGDGTQSRDFIYVKDAVNACILAAKSKIKCGVINIGTGIDTSFNELIELLNSKLRKNVKPKYVRNPIKNYVQETLADTKKAKTELGFTAEYTVEKGIDKIIQYYSKIEQD
ncbi:MAG: NAD-dependent epimerase/dehydratase family protein [Candidatus Hodarchaeota archaeon]